MEIKKFLALEEIEYENAPAQIKAAAKDILKKKAKKVGKKGVLIGRSFKR